ncbi:peptidoglycan-binding protein [Brachybacterium phenoliresistens]|uniref:peptidoglycan-binding protein n=1 Tax=Brachybacterium phenoliresistens TaxID=396014 RepID=UPI0031E33430
MASSNGRLKAADLTALPTSWSNQGRDEFLREDAAASLSRAMARAVADTGVNFQIWDAYRSLAEQEAMLRRNYTRTTGTRKVHSSDRIYQGRRWVKKAGAPNTATPGLSNHGTGTAIDLHPGPIQAWMQSRGREYGWSWEEGRRNGEPWHFTYFPSADQHRDEGALDHAWVQRIVGAEVDDKIGTGTVAKVRAWQAEHGLEADGKVGPATKAAMLGADAAVEVPEALPRAVVLNDDYDLERHQTRNLRPGRVDVRRGLTGELDTIVIHCWGADGQRFENVVEWLVADGNGNESSSAHEVIAGSQVAVLADMEDGTWSTGDAQANLDTYSYELRPEADELTIRTAAARIKERRALAGKDLPLAPHDAFTATSCPGRYKELLDVLDRLARGEAVVLPDTTAIAPTEPMKPWESSPRVQTMSRDEVREIQQLLLSAGQDLGRWGVDGGYGAATYAAVRAFQQQAGLTVDGIAGPDTLAALRGHTELEVDGRYGEATHSEVQRRLGRPVDGRLGAGDLAALCDFLGLPAYSEISDQPRRAEEVGNAIVPGIWDHDPGHQGPRSVIVRALEAYLGATVDRGGWGDQLSTRFQVMLNEHPLLFTDADKGVAAARIAKAGI